jgi:hypothetical protein
MQQSPDTRSGFGSVRYHAITANFRSLGNGSPARRRDPQAALDRFRKDDTPDDPDLQPPDGSSPFRSRKAGQRQASGTAEASHLIRPEATSPGRSSSILRNKRYEICEI